MAGLERGTGFESATTCSEGKRSPPPVVCHGGRLARRTGTRYTSRMDNRDSPPPTGTLLISAAWLTMPPKWGAILQGRTPDTPLHRPIAPIGYGAAGPKSTKYR